MQDLTKTFLIIIAAGLILAVLNLIVGVGFVDIFQNIHFVIAFVLILYWFFVKSKKHGVKEAVNEYSTHPFLLTELLLAGVSALMVPIFMTIGFVINFISGNAINFELIHLAAFIFFLVVGVLAVWAYGNNIKEARKLKGFNEKEYQKDMKIAWGLKTSYLIAYLIILVVLILMMLPSIII